VAAAALAVLDTIEADGLVEHADVIGADLGSRLDALGGSDLVAGSRGRGLLRALQLTAPVAADVVTAAERHGLVVNDVAPDAVRVAPPLLIGQAELDEMSERLGAALAEVEGTR
jgi:acetylornithine aminotransferase